MDKPYILHMFTATENLSPFDVNMALDAGWDKAMPYTSLDVGHITPLVQDVIFSRGPSGVKRTGIFIGGRDVQKALAMLDAARDAMVPPFEVSVMADPSGAFTTAAGMVAAVSGALDGGWEARRVLVMGGTGPVGMVAAVLAADLGAEVIIMSRAQEKADRAVEVCLPLLKESSAQARLCGSGHDHKAELLAQTDVVLATAAAGIEVMNAGEVAAAAKLKVAADVNAVPPSGVAGLEVTSPGSPLPDSASGAVGIGALAIGNIKYQSQHRLFKRMCETDKPLYLHYESACREAQDYVAEKKS